MTKTKMRDTSLEAYKTLDVSKQETLVLGALKTLKCKATNRQVAKYLKMDCSTVAGRMNALVKDRRKIVTPGKKVKDKVTKRRVMQWILHVKKLKLL